MAGHGVFINEMLDPRRDDCDNCVFTWFLLDWLLKKSDDTKHKFCLFIENESARPDFDVDLRTDALPELPPFNVLANAAMRYGNRIIREQEQKNFLNRGVLGVTNETRLRRVLSGLALIASSVVICYGLWRLSGPVSPTTPWPHPAGREARRFVAARADAGPAGRGR